MKQIFSHTPYHKDLTIEGPMYHIAIIKSGFQYPPLIIV